MAKRQPTVPMPLSDETLRDSRVVFVWMIAAGLALLTLVGAVVTAPQRATVPVAKSDPYQTDKGAPLYTGSITVIPKVVGTMPSPQTTLPADDVAMKLGDDLANLRQTVATLRRQNEMLVERLDQIEKDSAQRSAPAPAQIARTAPVDDFVTGSITKPNKPTDETAETGKPVTAPALKAPFGIEIGSFTSEAALASRWKEMRKQLSLPLGDLNAVQTRSVNNGTLVFTLIAGPFKTVQDANLACGAVSTRGLACTPANFAGQTVASR